MRKSAKAQLLKDLESDFPSLLTSCLEECRSGRWGLFGQNDNSDAARYLLWKDAKHLKEIALQIHTLRGEFGMPHPLVERFLYYCSLRGANVPGEPKLAGAFFDEIQRGDFQSSG